MHRSQVGAYQEVHITTADPANLVLQLYAGAARFLRQAQRALEGGDGAGFATSLSRAHAIIAQLSDTLDRDVGGEVVENLDRLYEFMLRHLTDGLIARNPLHLGQVLACLEMLHEGFQAALDARANGAAS